MANIMRTPSARLAQAFSNVGHSYSHILTILYPTVVLALEREWSMSYGELIGLMLAGQILFGVAALPAGWLGDRWSMLGMMVLFFIGSGVAAILTGLARSGLEIALGLALVGAFASIYHPVGMAWLVREAVNRGRALGVNGIFGAVGLASGPIIAGLLTDLISWRAAFIIPGATAALFGVGLVVAWALGFVRESKADIKPQPAPARGAVVRAFVILSVTMLCTGFLSSAYMVALPKIFAAELSTSTSAVLGAGAMVTVVYLFGALAQYVGGRLCDRYAMKNVYIVGAAVQLPLLVAATMVDGIAFLLPILVTTVFFQIVANPAENGLLAHFTPGKWRATAYGAKFVLALGVAATAIPAIGWIHDTTGGFTLLYVIMSVLAATTLAASFLLPNDRAAKEPAPVAVAQPAE